jgi:RNA recognition motif-containing protein
MTLFVNKIPIKWKEKDITALFEVYGTVTEIKMPIDHRSRQGRGYCFVTIEHEKDAFAAMDALNGIMYDERKIEVVPSVSKPAKPAPEKRSTPKSGTIDVAKMKKKLPPWLRKEY